MGARTKNTPDNVWVRYMVYKKQGEWHAVALEVNIHVVSNTADSAFQELEEAVHEYVEGVIENNATIKALNQTQPRHEKLWNRLSSIITPRETGTLPVVTA